MVSLLVCLWWPFAPPDPLLTLLLPTLYACRDMPDGMQLCPVKVSLPGIALSRGADLWKPNRYHHSEVSRCARGILPMPDA